MECWTFRLQRPASGCSAAACASVDGTAATTICSSSLADRAAMSATSPVTRTPRACALAGCCATSATCPNVAISTVRMSGRFATSPRRTATTLLYRPAPCRGHATDSLTRRRAEPTPPVSGNRDPTLGGHPEYRQNKPERGRRRSPLTSVQDRHLQNRAAAQPQKDRDYRIALAGPVRRFVCGRKSGTIHSAWRIDADVGTRLGAPSMGNAV